AHGAVWRHVARDAGVQRLSPPRGSVHDGALARVLHESTALHFRGPASRRARDHRPRARHHRRGRVVIVGRVGAVLAAGLASVVMLSARAVAPPPVSDQGEQRAARYFESIRHQPPEEWAFLKQMPKGGDLHTHFGGAIYAESMIGWAVQRG